MTTAVTELTNEELNQVEGGAAPLLVAAAFGYGFLEGAVIGAAFIALF